MFMWHYMLVNQQDMTIVPIDSSRREQFEGYPTQQVAQTIGDDRRYESKLPHYYKVVTFMVISPAHQLNPIPKH